MALVSDEYKFVFVHVPKTGGTSITEALVKAHGCELAKPSGYYKHKGLGRSRGKDIPAQFRPNGIELHDPYSVICEKYPKAKDYRVLAMVRNPWERIYSFYWHKRRRRDANLPVQASGQPCELNQVFKVSNSCLIQPQIWWFPEDAIVLRYENFPSYVTDFFPGLPRIEINRLNTNSHRSGAGWREEYDMYTRKLIEAYYQYEIDRYGYQFIDLGLHSERP